MLFSTMSLTPRTRRGGCSAVISFAAALLAVLVPMLVSPGLAIAQEKQPAGSDAAVPTNVTAPALVVTVASINKLMQDVNYITSVVGQPQAGGMFTMLAGGFTQGIDMDSPIGILVPLVDGVPEPIAMVPTADVKVVLKRLEAQTGPVDEQPDGTLAISIGTSLVYVRQAGNWAVLARNRALLDVAPADPTALFAGIGNEYDLAFRLKMQLIPPQTREMLTNQLRQGFEQAMRNQGDGDANRETAENSIKQLEQFIEGTDELKFGFNIDQSKREVAIDVAFTAVPGSKLSEMYSGQHAIPSQFASVIRDDAAMFYHAATSISPALVEQTRTSLQTSIGAIKNAIANEGDLTPEQADDIQQLIDRVSGLIVSSVAEGKVDGGALMLADSGKMQFVFGMFVSDGNEAAQIVKDVAEKIKNEPWAPKFQFNVATYKDINMHAVTIDIPEKADEARKMFGESTVLRIGTGPKSVFLAFGNGSDSLLKELIDASGTDQGGDRPIGQMRVHMMPILQYAQSIEANETVTAMIDALSRAPDLGVLKMVQDAIPNGQDSRVTISEGTLQAIGAAARHAQMKKMQNQNGNF